MKRKITLLASALVLMFSAGAVQAHGSLFGIFFKHHYHNACGYHANDHRSCHVHKHVKKHHGYHYGYKHRKYHGYHHYKHHGKELNW